jgi:hypothetical protein
MRHSRNMYGNEEGTACIAPEGQDLYANLIRPLISSTQLYSRSDKPLEAAEEDQRMK